MTASSSGPTAGLANGEVANKIGTYWLAALAYAHAIPFYVAAPTSTIDMNLESGDDIPIEQRDPEEVTHLAGQLLAPEGVRAAHPAFDVTPHLRRVMQDKQTAGTP